VFWTIVNSYRGIIVRKDSPVPCVRSADAHHPDTAAVLVGLSSFRKFYQICRELTTQEFLRSVAVVLVRRFASTALRPLCDLRSTEGELSWLRFLIDIITILECGPMPNVMVALPNTGGALCSTPQSLADAHY